MPTDCDFFERTPSVAEYRRLRAAVGWADLDSDAVEAGLANSLFSSFVVPS